MQNVCGAVLDPGGAAAVAADSTAICCPHRRLRLCVEEAEGCLQGECIPTEYRPMNLE